MNLEKHKADNGFHMTNAHPGIQRPLLLQTTQYQCEPFGSYLLRVRPQFQTQSIPDDLIFHVVMFLLGPELSVDPKCHCLFPIAVNCGMEWAQFFYLKEGT